MASTWRVTVRVLSVKGKHVDYHFQVDKQPLPAGGTGRVPRYSRSVF
jgi:hypothetical protein